MVGGAAGDWRAVARRPDGVDIPWRDAPGLPPLPPGSRPDRRLDEAFAALQRTATLMHQTAQCWDDAVALLRWSLSPPDQQVPRPATRDPLAPVPVRERLTGREREVLRLVAQGLPNRRIARQLGIAEKIVKNHVSAILTKLRVTDRTQAALAALAAGLLD